MKHRTKIATAALAALSLAGCLNLSEPAPFDPRGVQGSSRGATVNTLDRPRQPLPTTLESPFGGKNGRPATRPGIDDNAGVPLGTEPTIRMSLQEVIQRCVANNGEVRVAGYTPAIDQTRVTEAEARFDPTLFANSGVERRSGVDPFNENNNITGLGAVTYSIEGGVRQLLQNGAQVELRYRNALVDIPGPTSDTVYQNEVTVQLQQPLLRDFGNEINGARISINRNNQRISVMEFRRQLEETLSETERTYWQLVQAEREVRIAERVLQRAIDTAFIIGMRGVDDVTQAHISQSNASVQSRRSDLIAARSRVRDLSDQLKRAMQDPTIPTASPIVVLPAVPPIEEPVKFSKDETLAQAYENRLELGQQQLRVNNADIASDVAKNNLLPQLNLNVTGGLQGVDGQWINATADQFSLDSDNYSFQVALQFEIPIGNRAARAIYQRAMLQRMQAIEQYRSIIEQIQLDVNQSYRDVETTWDQIAANRAARFASADALASVERRREQGEALNPTFVQLVLDRQEALAQSERAEAQSVSNYNIAISRLELAKGTLLRYNNVLIEEEATPFVKTFGTMGR